MSGNTRIDTPQSTGAPQPEARPCDWPKCREEGRHRAPRSRAELRSYRWFCLAHVRQYNSAWNYYAGMSEDEVEDDVRMDTVWRRPTWRLGVAACVFRFNPHAMGDDFGLFNGAGRRARSRQAWGRRPRTVEEKAMVVLDLQPPLTMSTVKARYKELVKRHHPDANGGAKASEEKFKQINQAYETIMGSLAGC